MLHPEAAGLLVGAGESQAVFYLGMGEKGRVKINAHVMSFGEFHPFLKMFGLQFITVYKFAGLKDGVASVKVQLFLPGQRDMALSISAMSCSGVFALPG